MFNYLLCFKWTIYNKVHFLHFFDKVWTIKSSIYQFLATMMENVHRIGRTGRVGNLSKCVIT